MKNKIKMSGVQKTIFIIMAIFFSLYAFSIIFPLVWLLINTFKEGDAFYDIAFFPKKWYFMNYIKAFPEIAVGNSNVVSMIFNSLWYSVGGAMLGVIVSTCFAYVVSKYKFFGRRLLYFIAIVVMMIPIVGSLPSQYEVFDTLGMINSPLILLCFTSGFGLNFLVMLGIFDGLSWSYGEAAFIDGAGHFKVFFKIMLPQVFSTMTALFLVAFIGIWNDYMSPLIFMPNMPTLSTGIYIYEAKNKHNFSMSMPIYFSGIVICIIPVLILFLIFQNTVMDISISGGIKE